MHVAIVEAIRLRDPGAAETAMLRLLDDTAQNVERALRDSAVR
jgi:DNA-binding FadR family transcriptional regulator